METLVIGASGATEKLVVEQLLSAGERVKIIVRPSSNIPTSWNNHSELTVIRKNITALGIEEVIQYLTECNSVASCLGHHMTLKGLFGEPRALVADAVVLLCKAILKVRPPYPIKFVLMNTAGNSNRDLDESVSLGQKLIVGLIRILLRPHADNEHAANYLRKTIGQNSPYIEWAVVRPDALIDEVDVSDYPLHPSPTTSAIFKPGKTSRINVGHFMCRLMLDDEVWTKWKGKMPVIYHDQHFDVSKVVANYK